MQIVTVLLNNAIDACYDSPYPEVEVLVQTTKDFLTITVSDNGSGMDPAIQKSLFSPIVSTKATGMGVGLYIARHLAKSQFNGDLNLQPSKIGAQFAAKIPRKTKRKQ